MSKLDIKIYPDSVLRKKAQPLKAVGEDEQRLADDMIETMRYGSGVGLAAPQVGILKRIIVIEAIEKNSSPLILINPRLLKKKGRSSFCEGCLSIPEATCDITRSSWILVEGLNIKGELLKIEALGLLARVIQHEMDHLDGILFIDRIGFFKRKKVLRHISSKVCMEL